MDGKNGACAAANAARGVDGIEQEMVRIDVGEFRAIARREYPLRAEG